jgi:hypothetical protein
MIVIAIMVPIAAVIMIPVVVTPSPVVFLLLGRKLPEIPVAVAVGLVRPAIVVNDFVVVPAVIVGIVGVINAVGMAFGASDCCQGRS